MLRQYQGLFDQGMKQMKELAYHVCMNTRILGMAAIKRGDYAVLDLSLKFFNTYLRSAINVPDGIILLSGVYIHSALCIQAVVPVQTSC